MSHSVNGGASDAGNAPLRALVDVLFVVSFVYVSFRTFRDVTHFGGNIWRQGDWLVNTLEVDVRRGLVGEWIIRLSDLMGVSPLVTVGALQVVLHGALLLAFRRLLRGLDAGLAAILAISPAMFTVFWLADPPGSLRKEALAFLGLTVAALGLAEKRAPLLLAGASLLCLGFVAHEALLAFLPVFLAALALCWKGGEMRLAMAVSAGVVGLSAAGALAYALSHFTLSSSDPVCRPLLERGLAPEICDGAIRALAIPRDRMAEIVIDYISIAEYELSVAAYALALAPFVYLCGLLRPVRLAAAILVLTAAPFAPLFYIAVDWGRWMSMHVFSLVLLTIVALARGRLRVAAPPSPAAVAVILSVGLLMSPSHMLGMIPGGAVGTLAQFVARNLP